MQDLLDANGSYQSPQPKPGLLSRWFPSFSFYRRFVWIVWRSAGKAKRGTYDDPAWHASSVDVLRSLECVGVKVAVEGGNVMRQVDGPCVIVGNHMSQLETVVIPSFIIPYRRVTYVIKQSLLDYPVFKHVMRSRDPIAVTRTDPREDLKTVMTEGRDRLGKGMSVIVFPQTTRTSDFSPEDFNSIGVKLALKAKLPVVPLALQTDAWGNGKRLKDFGKIDPTKPVRFAFGQPLTVEGRGQDQHQAVVDFITQKLAEWRGE